MKKTIHLALQKIFQNPLGHLFPLARFFQKTTSNRLELRSSEETFLEAAREFLERAEALSLNRREFFGATAGGLLVGLFPHSAEATVFNAGAFWKRKPVATTSGNALDFDSVEDFVRCEFTGSNVTYTSFTLAFWIYYVEGNSGVFTSTHTNGLAHIRVTAGWGSVDMQIWNTNLGGTQALSTSVNVPANTWTHVFFSGSLAPSGAVNRYVNGVSVGAVNMNATQDGYAFIGPGVSQFIARETASGRYLKGRLRDLFFTNTAVDFSVAATRAKFITTDNQAPASSADIVALNPHMFFPLLDPTTAHINGGTKGNGVLVGTVARSGRGPEQYNCPYSDLDGSTHYLGRTSAPTGITDSKTFTLQFAVNVDTVGVTQRIICFGDDTLYRFFVSLQSGTAGFRIGGFNGTDVLNVDVTSPLVVPGRNYIVTISMNMANPSQRHIYINGQSATASWTTYTDSTIDFTGYSTPRYYVGRDMTASYVNGRLGGVFFHTSYIDLSVASNLAKFVTGTGIDAKPADLGVDGSSPLGVQPLIYLPMYGTSAGKNYGSGGDFTVNNGPFTGARGPSEFWGNKADFNGTNGSLSQVVALAGVSSGKAFSISFRLQPDTDGSSGATMIFALGKSGGVNPRLYIQRGNTNNLNIIATDSSGVTILNASTSAGSIAQNTAYFVQISIDLANASNRSIYIDGASASVTWTTYSNSSISFSDANRPTIGAIYNSSDTMAQYFDGKLSELFFTTEYIDFSQESNRLKFRDAFGNPVDLGSDGSKPTGTAPAIYMRFDPSNFGKNSGTGGDFTVTGTISDGGQI